jgi:SAM-dependent MidA family methyltransferase
MTALPWSQAWRAAAHDFWRASDPRDHFTTSVGPVLADHLAGVLADVDRRLGHPDDFHVVDIGCGDGTLLSLIRQRSPSLEGRARWMGVDLRSPAGASNADVIDMHVLEAPADLPHTPTRGVVMAHEWLDELPCDIVERDRQAVDRLVLVDPSGQETLGPPIADDAACAALGVDAGAVRQWLDRWWPLHVPGDRAEVGVARDAAWAWLTSLVTSGLVLATDYGHVRDSRQHVSPAGTLTGYHRGRVVRPVPDGSVGITAHVALDSCCAAVPGTSMTWQQEVIGPARLPPVPKASDVQRHFSTLALRDPARLGGIAWLEYEAY